MYELVSLKGNDVFTDSWVIAEGTGNSHESVIKLIKKYHNDFSEFGKITKTDFKSDENSDNLTVLQRNRKLTIYNLNEPQASYLITLLDNNSTVRRFKLNLVKEFYRMRKFLIERQSTEWMETRKNGKLTRREETDILQELCEYAVQQGSETYRHKPQCIYIHYSNLVNKAVGIKKKQREIATTKTLTTIAFIEDMILNVVKEEMAKGTSYKDIYQKCKAKAIVIVELSYLPEQRLLIA